MTQKRRRRRRRALVTSTSDQSHINALSRPRHLRDGSEETAGIRPLWRNCCKEAVTEEEENCWGQEAQGMDTRPGEIFGSSRTDVSVCDPHHEAGCGSDDPACCPISWTMTPNPTVRRRVMAATKTHLNPMETIKAADEPSPLRELLQDTRPEVVTWRVFQDCRGIKRGN